MCQEEIIHRDPHNLTYLHEEFVSQSQGSCNQWWQIFSDRGPQYTGLKAAAAKRLQYAHIWPSESSVRASTSTAFNAPNKSWQQVGFGGGVLIQELHTGESCPLYVHEKITLLQNEYKYRVIGTASLTRCLVNILTTTL